MFRNLKKEEVPMTSDGKIKNSGELFTSHILALIPQENHKILDVEYVG